MAVKTDFKMNINKKQVINTVMTYNSSYLKPHLDELYELLLPTFIASVETSAIYTLEKNKYPFNMDLLASYEYIIPCAITIGNNIADLIDSLLKEHSFFEAILLDTMGNSLLFNMSRELFKELALMNKSKGIGLSCRISPGDGDLDISYQSIILDTLKDENIFGFKSHGKYPILPSKSMSYIYGGDKKIKYNELDHDCNICNNITCIMRT